MQAISNIVSQIQELVDDRSTDLPGDVHLALCKLTKQAYEQSKGGSADIDEDDQVGLNVNFNEINLLVESAHQGRRSREDFLLMIREPNNTLALAALCELARDGEWDMSVFVRPIVGQVRARDASDTTKHWALRLLVAMLDMGESEAKDYGGELLASGIFYALAEILERGNEIPASLDEACLEVLHTLVMSGYNPLLHDSPGVVHTLIPRIADPRYQTFHSSPVSILSNMAAAKHPWCSKTVDFVSDSVDAMCSFAEITLYHEENRYGEEMHDAVRLLTLIARQHAKNKNGIANVPVARQLARWVIDKQELCLRIPDGLGCRLRAAECLGHMARAGGADLAALIAGDGTIPPLVDLLARRGATRTQRSWVAFALTHICCTDALRDTFVAKGGLHALRSAIEEGPTWVENTEERPQNTARFLLAIGDIAHGCPLRRTKICNTEGLLAHFAHAMREENAVDLRGAAAAALSNVCFRSEDAKLALCRMGAMVTVVQLLLSSSPPLRSVGGRLTANLVAHCTEARVAFALAGGLDALFAVVRRGNAGELEASCSAAENALVGLTNLAPLVSASRKRPREGDPPADPPADA